MRVRPSALAWVPVLVAALSAAGRSVARADDPVTDETRGYVMFIPRPIVLLRDGERKGLGVTAESGVVVVDVTPGGPGDKAGLKIGDLLVKYKGADVPDGKDLDPKDAEAERKWGEAFSKVSHTVKPGDEVEMVVQRDGKPVTLKAVAVDKETKDRIDRAAQDEMFAVKVPDPKAAGTAVRETYDFEHIPDDKALPDDFLSVKGVWETFEEEGAQPANHVLRQYTSVDPWAVCLVTGKGHAYGAATVSVRFMPLSGKEDASGGIVFRAQDRKNFYLARANALEDNLRLYVVKDGKRTQLATVEVAKPKLKSWHTLDVAFDGAKLKATLDGKTSVEASDDSFASGWCGLWTKADSETQFDDLKVTPTPSK